MAVRDAVLALVGGPQHSRGAAMSSVPSQDRHDKAGKADRVGFALCLSWRPSRVNIDNASCPLPCAGVRFSCVDCLATGKESEE